MAEQGQAKQSLSEIGELFLSSVRKQQTGGAALPRRKGPAAVEEPPLHCRASIDLTEEEFAQVMGPAPLKDAGPGRIGDVCAVIGAQAKDGHSVGVREYARHLAAAGKRVGLMEVDGSEFRLAVFDRTPLESDGAGAEAGDVVDATFDGAAMAAAIDELSWDVDCWLLALPAWRTQEARSLLKNVDHWVLLSTAHPDGVVGCYRIMKGLADLHQPRVTLALLEVGDESEAEHAHRKLAGVAGQFLHWNVERGPSVHRAAGVTEHVALWYRAAHDKGQGNSGGHWQVLVDFLVKSRVQTPRVASPGVLVEESPRRSEPQGKDRSLSHGEPPPQPSPGVPGEGEGDHVVEIADAGEGAVLDAVLSRGAGALVECPLRPPACPSARLTVTRQRGLLLLAVARAGLDDLRAIALAYRWLLDNRALIAMALPQLSIDGGQRPGLRLLVDHADAGAQVLAPLIENGSVTLQTYRKLKWGAKTGLLLEAA